LLEPLLNAFRIEANDDFLAKGELVVVVMDECAEWADCAKGRDALRAGRRPE